LAEHALHVKVYFTDATIIVAVELIFEEKKDAMAPSHSKLSPRFKSPEKKKLKLHLQYTPSPASEKKRSPRLSGIVVDLTSPDSVKPELPGSSETAVDAKEKLEKWLEACSEEELMAAMAEQEAKQKHEKEEEVIVSGKCKHCLLKPCLMEGYYYEFVSYCDVVLEMNLDSHRLARNKLYMFMSSMIHGPLGKGVRRKLPGCVECAVREQFPDPMERYTGFKADNNSDESEAENEL
jgi:hypothetical protein